MDHPLEILIVDDDSRDGTPDLVRALARQDPRIRIIQRVDVRLASAIEEGLIAAIYPIAVVMDSDGRHEPTSVGEALQLLDREGLDLVAGSRFLDLSEIEASVIDAPMAHPRQLAVGACPGLPAPERLHERLHRAAPRRCLPLVRQVDVNGFKFFYELLAISRGSLQVGEIPLHFQPRLHGNSSWISPCCGTSSCP